MAFVTISSSNKNFSYELNKNPKTGMQVQELREGYILGFFSKRAKNFNIYFQDNPIRCSFNEDQIAKGDIEYNDLERYSSPLCYLTIIDKMLSIKEPTDLKSESDEDTVFDYEISINSIHLHRPFLLEYFKKDLKDRVTILDEAIGDHSKYRKITFSNKTTHVFDLLQVVKIFLLLASQTNNYEIQLEDAQVEKYLKLLVGLDLNYQLRSLFKNKLLTPSLFKRNVALLNTSSRANLDLKCNNNFAQRKEYIVNEAGIDYRNCHLIDMGCGEGNYVKTLYKKLLANNVSEANFSYVAIDPSEEALEQVRRVASKNQFKVLTFSSLEAFLSSKDYNSASKYTIVCTEVIEHNTKDQAEELLLTLKSLSRKQLLITTPNKAFNTYYNMLEDEVRHEDHHYELNKEEFTDLIKKTFAQGTLNFSDIGDSVNSVSSTLAVSIS